MKKTNLVFLLLASSVFLYGQEFEFRLYFEDAMGNRDTIIAGYDVNGSPHLILSEFGEENIVDLPFDSVFEVRITNHLYYQMYDVPLFHTRKKIVALNCDSTFLWYMVNPFVSIDIMAQHWPVTVSWDAGLFQDSCRLGSLFTSWEPGFWWDSGQSFSDLWRVFLNDESAVTFSANYPDNWDDFPDEGWPYYYVDNNGNPIATFWMAFGDSTMLTMSDNDLLLQQDVLLYPNPSSGKVSFKNADIDQIKKVRLFSTDGKVRILENSIHHDLSALAPGVYIIAIESRSGSTINLRWVKY